MEDYMYEEIRKQKYFDFVKSTHKLSKAKERELEAIFEKISEVEINRNLDIAQIDPAEYPEIIYQTFDIQRFTYFRQLYYRIHQYREFVFDKGLLDTKWLFIYNKEPRSLNGEDLFNIFLDLREKFDPEIIFYNTDYLCKYLEKYLYPILLLQEDSFASYLQEGVAVFAERIEMVYAVLTYLGVEKENRCAIPKSSFINSDNSIMFLANKRLPIYISEYTREIINKVLNADFMLFLRDSSKHGVIPVHQELHKITLLSYAADETIDDMKKRSNVMYMKFSSRSQNGIRKIPSLGNIAFQGVISEICKRIHSDEALNTNTNIIKLFNYLTDSKLSFGDIGAYEVTREVDYRYKYMLEHNLL